jgi:hypothetical protein
VEKEDRVDVDEDVGSAVNCMVDNKAKTVSW